MQRNHNHPVLRRLAPLLGVVALAALPATASAATPTPATPCSAVPPSAPCYTTAPSMMPPPLPTPQNEVTSPQVGRTILGNKGAWQNPTPTFYKTQWMDCDATATVCTPAAGSPNTNTTYKIVQGDVTHYLVFQVIANGTASANSAPSGLVNNGTPLNRVAPTLTGMTLDGQTMMLTSGTWDGTNMTGDQISYSYQWRRCDGAGLNCSKAFTGPPGPAGPSPTLLSSGYTLQDADLGHIMVGYVTATNNEGATPVHSHTTSTVVTPGNTSAPTISGTAQAGQKLTESHGSWIPNSPTSYSYQWQDCDASGAGCSAIAGATAQTYTPTNADASHTLRVLESATAGGVTSSPATSAATGVVKAASSTGGGTGGGTGGTGGNTGGQGGSGGTVTLSASKIRGLLRQVLAVHGKAGTIRGVLKHAGYSFSFAAPSAGRLVMGWYSTPKHGKKVLVATVTLVFHGSGRATAKIQLTAAGRRLLSGTRRMKLTAKGSFTPAGHGAVSASRQFTLKA
jgi:hypothetical protein